MEQRLWGGGGVGREGVGEGGVGGRGAGAQAGNFSKAPQVFGLRSSSFPFPGSYIFTH